MEVSSVSLGYVNEDLPNIILTTKTDANLFNNFYKYI